MRVSRPDEVCPYGMSDRNGREQAAPENDPASGCSIGLTDRDSGQSIAMGSSREPPAFTFLSRTMG
jgi:hypothetical protein